MQPQEVCSQPHIIIDEEFKDLLPPLSNEQFAELEGDIREKGCLQPLTLWKESGILVDGHQRYQICTNYNIPFQTISLSFNSRLDALFWAWSNQKNRRNMAKYEIGKIALRFKPLIQEKAKENKRISGKIYGEKHPKQEVSLNLDKPFVPIDTKKELATITGVSHGTIAKIEKIEEKATPEQKAALKAGKASINKVYQQIVASEQKPHLNLVPPINQNKETDEPDFFDPASQKEMKTIRDIAESIRAVKMTEAIENYMISVFIPILCHKSKKFKEIIKDGSLAETVRNLTISRDAYCDRAKRLMGENQQLKEEVSDLKNKLSLKHLCSKDCQFAKQREREEVIKEIKEGVKDAEECLGLIKKPSEDVFIKMASKSLKRMHSIYEWGYMRGVLRLEDVDLMSSLESAVKSEYSDLGGINAHIKRGFDGIRKIRKIFEG